MLLKILNYLFDWLFSNVNEAPLQEIITYKLCFDVMSDGVKSVMLLCKYSNIVVELDENESNEFKLIVVESQKEYTIEGFYTILRFLGRLCGAYPDNLYLAAQTDMLMDSHERYSHASDDVKAEVLNKLNKDLEINKWISSNDSIPTVSDFCWLPEFFKLKTESYLFITWYVQMFEVYLKPDDKKE